MLSQACKISNWKRLINITGVAELLLEGSNAGIRYCSKFWSPALNSLQRLKFSLRALGWWQRVTWPQSPVRLTAISTALNSPQFIRGCSYRKICSDASALSTIPIWEQLLQPSQLPQAALPLLSMPWTPSFNYLPFLVGEILPPLKCSPGVSQWGWFWGGMDEVGAGWMSEPQR